MILKLLSIYDSRNIMKENTMEENNTNLRKRYSPMSSVSAVDKVKEHKLSFYQLFTISSYLVSVCGKSGSKIRLR